MTTRNDWPIGSDDPCSCEQTPISGNFQGLSDVIIRDYLPRDQSVERVYLGTPAVPNADAARLAIRNAIQNGAFMVQYMGHGAIDTWAHEVMWRKIDVEGLQNNSALPLVMTFNCLDGYFAYPGSPSMAEVMLLRQGGGSVGGRDWFDYADQQRREPLATLPR
jgi:hypothetical protein